MDDVIERLSAPLLAPLKHPEVTLMLWPLGHCGTLCHTSSLRDPTLMLDTRKVWRLSAAGPTHLWPFGLWKDKPGPGSSG